MIDIIAITLLITTVALVICKLLFKIGSLLCWVVGFLTEVFDKVSGISTITYRENGLAEEKNLINVFFGNYNINVIYWGMALIGIVMCIGFTIAAVIKKSGDADDKMKQSMGGILKNGLKSIILILLMNFIISATISITSTLLNRINYLMVNSEKFDLSYDVTFDSEDYACMARCLNSIGNYSLNASYNSRYNLNSCYNDIREDLEYLAEKGKFEISYYTTTHEEDGTVREVDTWQSVLQKIYRSVDDISVDQPLDEYNSDLSEALLEAMDIIKNDASFEALEKYHVSQTGTAVGEMVSLDRMIMLIGSIYQLGGSSVQGSGMTDNIRGPYYYGIKDVFDYDTVKKDFDMDLGTWLYITVILVAIFFIKEMLKMVFNAAARIFNMILLYISAPPIIAVTPLDDGGKLKQWTTAFIIQSLGLFGNVIAMRLVMIFIPYLFHGNIQFFDDGKADTAARIIIMAAFLFTARKASSLITGILSDNGAGASAAAGDLSQEANHAVDTGVGVAKSAASLGWGLVKGAYGMAKGGIEKAQKAAGKAKPGEGNKELPKPKLDMGTKTNAQPPTPGGTPDTSADLPDNQGNITDQGGGSPDQGGGSPDQGGDLPNNQGNLGAQGGGNPDQGGGLPDNQGNLGTQGGSPDQGGGLPDNQGNFGAQGGSPDQGGGSPDLGSKPGEGRQTNSTYENSRGSYETGSTTAARDFESDRIKLQDKDRVKPEAPKSKDDSNIGGGSRRMSLDNDPPQPKNKSLPKSAQNQGTWSYGKGTTSTGNFETASSKSKRDYENHNMELSESQKIPLPASRTTDDFGVSNKKRMTLDD